MDREELERLIVARRAAYRAYISHVNTCPLCRTVAPGDERPEGLCAEADERMRRRHALGEQLTTGARALGFNSPSAYERTTYGRVGRL